MGTDIELANERPDHELAITERGTRLDKYTEGEVNLALRTLILSGGDVKGTVGALAEEGIVIKHDALRYWRDVAFSARYYKLREELAQTVGEEVAGRAMERALQADEAESRFIEKAVEKIEDVSPDRLASAARDLSGVKASNIEKAQLLRNKPTEIRETRDTGEILDQLRRLGILTGDPRDAAIEGNASEKN